MAGSRFKGWGFSYGRYAPVVLACVMAVPLCGVRARSAGGHTTVRHQNAAALASNNWVANGRVHAFARSASTLYMAGDFTQIGPRTGPAVGISTTTGTSLGFPQLSGGLAHVWTAVPDGAGGYYIGGNFTHVGMVARANLAHVLKGGTVDPTFDAKMRVASAVYALLLSGTTLYVGGAFPAIGGQLRNNAAALKATTGKALAWNANITAGKYSTSVDALAALNSTVLIGGDFTKVGSASRSSLAAVDSLSGAVTAWDPNVRYSTTHEGEVDALAVSGNTVYAGGGFMQAGGLARSSLAAVDAMTGMATSWNPTVTGGGCFGGGGAPLRGRRASTPFRAECGSVRALTVAGSVLYVGGNYRGIAGVKRGGLAAISTTTAKCLSWNPRVGPVGNNTGASNGVNAMTVSGATVYIGGWFSSVLGQPRMNLAAVSVAPGTASLTSWNPNANAVVDALVPVGKGVLAAGGLTSIGGVTRKGLAAVDASSGRPTAWDPLAAGQVGAYGGGNGDISFLAISGPTLFVAGEFDHIAGQPRNGIAAIDRTTGTVTAWDAHADQSSMLGLAATPSTVYVSGYFYGIGGADNRCGLAALSVSTGAATSWRGPGCNGDEDNFVGQILLSGGYLYGVVWSSVLETWQGIGRWSLSRSDSLYESDEIQGDGASAIAVSGSTLYAAGDVDSVGGIARTGAAAFSLPSLTLTSWNPSLRPKPGNRYPYTPATSIAASPSVVYIGGSLTSVGGQARGGLAEIDPVTGAATEWNPMPNGGDLTLAYLGSSLYAGGGFTSLDQQAQSGFAVFPNSP